MLPRALVAIVMLCMPLVGFAVATPPKLKSSTLRGYQISKPVMRASQYVDVRHISARDSCEMVHPPEALTTPDPLFSPATLGKKVKVSFIIGTDGRVHSPLILESAGIAGDRRVLQTVRTWRYRPATCNGVPTENEGKVEFSSH